MIRRRWTWLVLAAWSVALLTLGTGTAGHVAAAAAQAGNQHRVLVGHAGFAVEGGAPLAVRAGERVTLTFVYNDKDLDYDNPHRIYLPTLDLQTDLLSQDNPEVTVSFVATESGQIPFKCVEQCQGHKALQDGYIEVSAGAAGAVPTRLHLEVAQPDGGVALVARLQTESGEPVSGSQVAFYEDGEFLGARSIGLGQALTDETGTAQIRYRPRRSGEKRFAAAFAGNIAFQPSEAIAPGMVPAAAVEHRELEPAQLYVPGMGNWILWTVVAAVWSTFGFVIYSTRRIPRVAGAAAGAATPAHLMANAAAQHAGHLAGAPGGGSTWALQHTVAPKGVDKVSKVAAAVLGVLLVVTWGVTGYRMSAERETRLAAEKEIRGNLAIVTQDVQALRSDLQPAAARQQMLADKLDQLLASQEQDVTTLKATLTELGLQVQSLQGTVTQLQASGGKTQAAGSSTAKPAVREIAVSAYHYGWDPNVIEVTKGERVRLVVRNDTKRMTQGLEAHPAKDAEFLHGVGIEAYGIEQDVPVGKTTVIEFVADKAGEFPIECTVWCGMGKLADGTRRGHPDMVGKLIVR